MRMISIDVTTGRTAQISMGLDIKTINILTLKIFLIIISTFGLKKTKKILFLTIIKWKIKKIILSKISKHISIKAT
jgi:hypothetical protein